MSQILLNQNQNITGPLGLKRINQINSDTKYKMHFVLAFWRLSL
jgi:hypothetical protein